jgi:hypothetical protein
LFLKNTFHAFKQKPKRQVVVTVAIAMSPFYPLRRTCWQAQYSKHLIERYSQEICCSKEEGIVAQTQGWMEERDDDCSIGWVLRLNTKD